MRVSVLAIFSIILFCCVKVHGQVKFSIHYWVDSSRQLSIDELQIKSVQEMFDAQELSNSNFGFDESAYWFRIKLIAPQDEELIVEVRQNSLDSVTLYQRSEMGWNSETQGHSFNPRYKKHGGVNYAFQLKPNAQEHYFYIRVSTSGTVAVPIYIQPQNLYTESKLKRTLFLGVFFGLMFVMAIYNLLIYFYLRDRAYILYVGATAFGLIVSLILNGYGYLFFWPEQPYLDDHIYLTFAGLSMFCSSRFAATFLNLKDFDPKMNKLLWLIALASLLLTVLSSFYNAQELLLYGRVLVLFSFPTYIYIGIRNYLKGYRTAIFYVIAWVPYILGLILVTLRGAGLVPEMLITAYGIEIGGASEAVLLSLALAARIKGMRKEITEKELEKEQFKTRLLSEQKVLLEEKVEERTKDLEEANATKDKFFSIIAHDLRSPMIALQGVGQKLEYFIRKNKQEKLLEIGGKIDQSIDQLNHLLNNLLNWASSQTAAIPYNPERFLIKALVLENINLYQSLIEAKKLKVNTSSIGAYVYADVNTLSTIIRNLLSNAIKFSQEGGIVSIEWRQLGNKLEFSIRDNGLGMTPGQVLELFEDSVQTTPGASGEKGFGLGLKLTKEFVAKNNGQITVKSEKNVGTTFTLIFPANP